MTRLSSSFRDPCGFVFRHDDCTYRQVNTAGAESFDQFVQCGLYQQLVSKNLLIAHEEVSDPAVPTTPDAYKLLKPQQIGYISYPYEWSFSQLKDAAILTLRIQAIALQKGFSLKDASAYNVQFVNSRPIFIDTLSFEPYIQGSPWVAYRQFCQHFLAPLALMAHTDIDLGSLLVTHIDGIPLALASKLLPLHTHFSYATQVHIHLHARMQAGYADTAGAADSVEGKATRAKNVKLSAAGLRAIVESLAALVGKLEWKPPKTEWGDYYDHTNYSDRAAQHKQAIVGQLLQRIDTPMRLIQDLGANTGEFSRIAAGYCDLVVSQDIDPLAVERNYRRSKVKQPDNLLPLVQNLFSPSPAIGWANEERESFRQRAGCDAILALALVHHLAISNNLPLFHIAELFASLAGWLIIEFVPKTDSQVVRLLETRKDIFPDYTEQGFEQAFSHYFSVVEKRAVEDSTRTIYLLKSLR